MSTPTNPSSELPRATFRVSAIDSSRVEGALIHAGLIPVAAEDLETRARPPLCVAVLDPMVEPMTEPVAEPGAPMLPALQRLYASLGDTPIVLLCGPVTRQQLVGLIASPNVRAVVARDQQSTDDALQYAIESLSKGPRFGLSTFVTEQAPRFSESIGSSVNKDALLERLADFAARHGVRGRLVNRVVTATEELITNALYDAPTDETGARIYAELDRRHAVFLSERSRPSVHAAVGRDAIFISVTDPHGSLATADVKRYLTKGLDADAEQIDDKRGGAGLGFARTFTMVDRMIVQIAADSRSEVTLEIGLRGARRDRAARPTGLVLCG